MVIIDGIPAEVFTKSRSMDDVMEVYRRSIEIAMNDWKRGGEAPEISDLMRWTGYRMYLLGVEDGMK